MRVPAIHAEKLGMTFVGFPERFGVDAWNSGIPEFQLVRTEVGNGRLRAQARA